ncbi:hypothetical protein A1Q1_05586 [Trichosporon asahii var. asahii CBS 2479]|uniref:Uncharacterized protein n=1 Tax=Trichosporon asahii var. asahii (strain ATCC 90039 / CBS 2479 / JCM 2466 / KCTC 7840 / NBRC 103889/ NCYC 2677 / UAMH 7654) TaxID=1186058 RepID=J5SJP5_TRIAS|nr:hypothetical protein A1Q1_05586 [Trichosporon asahii var. asahii CBS 2479]EJT45966.1 hypothetical protein A1Q1_05586 [Trichosporon asahii var. asahii CBS 2479]
MLILRLAALASLAAAVPLPNPKPDPLPEPAPLKVSHTWAMDESAPDSTDGEAAPAGPENAGWMFDWNKLLDWFRSHSSEVDAGQS